jgi:transcriptional regulator with XRE-family HTH domain
MTVLALFDKSVLSKRPWMRRGGRESLCAEMGVIDESVGRRVRLARERAGLTQEQFAYKLGVETTSISRYETAQRAFSLEMLERVARALDVNLGWLLEERLGQRTPTAKLRRDEEELLMMYRNLTGRQRAVARWAVREVRRMR